MKSRLTQFVGLVVLSGALLGGPFAQDADKQARREVKREVKKEHSIEKWDRWTVRQEAKRVKQLEKERRFNTLSTARGSEVGMIDAQGKYVTIGYMDRFNNFRPYQP